MKLSHILSTVAVTTLLSFVGACSSTGPGPNVKSDEGVQFNLSQCELLNNEFHCQLTIMSEHQNASLEIKNNTKLIDDQGNEYPLTAGSVASLEIKNDMYAKVQKELTAGSPVNATFIFENIATSAKSVKELIVAGRIKIHNHVTWEDYDVTLKAPPQEENK